MRTIAISTLGGPEVLVERELPEPRPGSAQVCIRVAYAGVNYADIMDRQRGYHIDQFPYIPGREVAGYIHTLGEGVEGFTEGQPVAAFVKGGGYAEFALAPAQLTFPLESASGQLDLATASGILMVASTAYDVLVNVARLQPGETVLIHAAAGGVGSIAGQLARLLGAGRVLGTVGSTSKMAYAQSRGYQHVFLREHFGVDVQHVTGGRGVDVIIDTVGEPIRSQGLELLAPFGRLVHCGNASGNPDVPIAPTALLTGNKGILGYSLTNLSRVAPERLAQTARKVIELLASGQLRLDITEALPLTQAAEAHRRIESNASTGKLILQM